MAGDALDIRELRKTYRYQQFRDRFMRRHPLCAECERQGLVRIADEMDHIVPVNQAPDRVWDETNLQGLCRPCHLIKTARENGRLPNPERERREARFARARQHVRSTLGD